MTTRTESGPAPWINRIVAHSEMDPHDLLPNPQNWRVHPDAQRLALSGALDEIGWIQAVIYNQRTGRLVDGHLRRDLALLRGEPTIPVTVVDLTPEDEAKALATIDPLSAMAQSDDTLLLDLLATIQTSDTALSQLLDDLTPIAPGVGGSGPADPQIPADERYKEQYGVIVLCQDEADQEITYDALHEMGYEVKVVVT